MHGIPFYCIMAKKKKKEGVRVKLKKTCVLITGRTILFGGAF